MCLTVSRFHHPTLKPKTAKRDIPCYKVVEFTNKGVETPYYAIRIDNYTIRLGMQPDSFPEEPFLEEQVRHGIHSFRTRKKAEEHAAAFTNCAVLACHIPKGSKYWVGKDKDYASSYIKFNHWHKHTFDGEF